MTEALVVMGVSGCGKTTVGAALAAAMGSPFLDADDFHPPANVEKMRQGFPLNDDDRAPWLLALNEALRAACAKGQVPVLACSALKERYRQALSLGLTVKFVHLSGTIEEIAARIAKRQHLYMPASLLQSQFTALEESVSALRVPVSMPVMEQVAFIRESASRESWFA